MSPLRWRKVDYGGPLQALQEHGDAEAAREALPRERRAAARVKTFRDAVFIALAGPGLLRQGTALDISLTGVQIRTFQPEPPDTYAEIELNPKPGDPASRAILMRGRVVRVADLGTGEFAMGVRIHMPLWRDLALKTRPIASTRVASPGTLMAGPRLTARNKSSKLPARTPAGADQDQTKSRRKVAWVIFLSLLLLLLGGPIGHRTLIWAAHPGTPITAQRGASSEDRSALVESPEMSKHSGNAESPRQLLRRAQQYLTAGRIDYAARTFRLALAQQGETPHESLATLPSPTEQFLVRLGYAQSLAAQDEPALALALVRKALKVVQGVPEPWIYAALELEATLLERGLRPMPVEPLRDAPVLKPVESLALAHELSIVVDKSDYVLTIYLDGQPIQAFPVGLGQDGATPAGAFQIVNKIRNPDWYNRGQVVKADDPRNPLGDYWMGLGTDAHAISYGIHPTNEPKSIGRNMSRGCIRMRPADAKTVFRLCPSGTRVLIYD